MLLEQIDQDLKTAQKEKDETTVLELRNLKAALKNAEIESGKPLTDPEALKVIAKKAKQHKDSIESFKAGNRQDLVDNEAAQLKILEKYQPKGLTEPEVAKIVADTIASGHSPAADFGKVMKEVMAKVAGRADGSLVTKLVKENLK